MSIVDAPSVYFQEGLEMVLGKTLVSLVQEGSEFCSQLRDFEPFAQPPFHRL